MIDSHTYKMNDHTLFLDESGLAELTDDKYRYFLLTGVRIRNEESLSLKGYFPLIKRKYDLEQDVPFHTYDLLSKKQSSSYLSDAEAESFIESMCEFIDLIPLEFHLVYVNKEELKDDYDITGEYLDNNKSKISLPYYLCALNQFRDFTDLLTDTDTSGEVIADSRTYQDKVLLNAFLDIKQARNLKGDRTNTYFDEARKRLNSITFADKNSLLVGVQLADFVSFIAYQKLNRRLSTGRSIGIPKVWRKIKENAEEVDLRNAAEEEVKAKLQ